MEEWLNIVSPRWSGFWDQVSACEVEGAEEVRVFIFLTVLAMLISVGARHSEVDKIDVIWIIMSNKNVFRLQVVVNEADIMQGLDSIDL